MHSEEAHKTVLSLKKKMRRIFCFLSSLEQLQEKSTIYMIQTWISSVKYENGTKLQQSTFSTENVTNNR